MTDVQIIELYWNRDENAIKQSDIKYGPYCRKIAYNILYNSEDTEECVNDTWFRSWDNIPPQKPNSLSAFFGRIIRNLSISRYRANHAKKRYDGITALLSELEECIPSNNSTEKTVELKLLTEIIEKWLTTLSKDDRALFLRRYWYGDAVKTLAKENGSTESQMAKKMFRLRNALKAVLEQEGIDV